MCTCKSLAVDVILGEDVLSRFKYVNFHFGDNKPTLHLNAIIGPQKVHPTIFKYLTPNCKLIVVKSRPHSKADCEFMQQEVERVLKEGKILKPTLLWRAHPFVVNKGDGSGKQRVIDCSMTINKCTLLDTYPMPRIEDIINKVAKFKVISQHIIKHH